jgi:hypothetical protein
MASKLTTPIASNNSTAESLGIAADVASSGERVDGGAWERARTRARAVSRSGPLRAAASNLGWRSVSATLAGDPGAADRVCGAAESRPTAGDPERGLTDSQVN